MTSEKRTERTRGNEMRANDEKPATLAELEGLIDLIGDFDPLDMDDVSENARDYDVAAELLEMHASYLRVKARAMSGRIPAETATRTLKVIFDSLPEWAKW